MPQSMRTLNRGYRDGTRRYTTVHEGTRRYTQMVLRIHRIEKFDIQAIKDSSGGRGKEISRKFIETKDRENGAPWYKTHGFEASSISLTLQNWLKGFQCDETLHKATVLPEVCPGP